MGSSVSIPTVIVRSIRDNFENLIDKKLVDKEHIKPTRFKAGQIKNKVEKWKDITKDKEILMIVRGATIELDSEQELNPILDSDQICRPRSRSDVDFAYQCNKEKREIIDKEITCLLDKGVIEECQHSKNEIISPIFSRPKKDNRVRIILNLKNFNKSVKYYHFKMDTLHVALKLIKKDSFMASVDLRDAYYSVPIREEDQEFLKFYWNKKLFKFTVFPNGLACCPRLFTKLLKPVLAYLHGLGLTNTMFIDDTLLIADGADECNHNIKETTTLFTDLGFVVHPTKSQLCPSKEIEYLGFLINSSSMTVRLTNKKKEQLASLCIDYLKMGEMSIRELAMIIGKIVASFPGVMFGPLWYRNLEECKKDALRLNRGSYDAKLVLSRLAKEELTWWIKNLNNAYNNIDTSHGDPTVVIHSDASSIGWGCSSGTVNTGGDWNFEEMKLHINVLELKAAYLALKVVANNLSHCHVRLMVDNTTAVSCINNMGTSHSIACNQMTKEIWLFCISRDIWISAAYIPGKENVIADKESRKINLDMEWKIHSEILKQALKNLEFKPNYDLFASRNNYQFKPFASFKADPESEVVDSLSISWKGIQFYAFPPFCLIPRVLQKIRVDQATGVIVVPNWKNQAWYPLLGKMLIKRPLKISPRKNLLSLPANPQITHRLAKSLSLLCCVVSGKDTKTKEFQRNLQSYSHPLGEEEQSKVMIISSTNGKDMLLRRVLVPFLLL